MGLKLSGPLPAETTILNFRHLLEKHGLGQGLLEEINAHLEAQGLRFREGTIVDASIIEAPSSTKNRARERDPEMHQTKKGNQWHFGMKAHIGVDCETGIVHSMTATAANVHDVTEAQIWCMGARRWCGGMLDTKGFTSGRRIWGWMWKGEWRCSLRDAGDSTLGVLMHWWRSERNRYGRRACPRPRSGVEHPFLRVKRLFGYAKSLPPTPIGGALPWAGEEHGAVGTAVRTGEPARGRGTTEGEVRPAAFPVGLLGGKKLNRAPSKC